jgi:hypothetical protein
MTPLDSISFLAKIAGLTGLTLKDALELSKFSRQNKLIVRNICRYLAQMEKVDDPLSGMWRVQEWDYWAPEEYFNGRLVNGFLAVLYQDKLRKWQCNMSLEYRKHPQNFLLFFSGNGRIAHRFNQCFTGTYNVEFMKIEGSDQFYGTTHMPDRCERCSQIKKERSDQFYGTCTMEDSLPSLDPSNGEFQYATITEKGALEGYFENTNVKDHQGRPAYAHFTFAQRRSWSDYGMSIQV